MYQTTLSPEVAVGHILRHNIASANGHKALAKGRRLSTEDAAMLRELGITAVPVAIFESDDVHEDAAASHVANAVAGANIIATPPVASRVNLLAAGDGIVQVDSAALLQLNQIDGITLATRLTNSLARARERIATIKIIPFAVPQSALVAVTALQADYGHLISLRPLQAKTVGVLLVGSVAARERIEHGVYPAIAARVQELGSVVARVEYVATEEALFAAAIKECLPHVDLMITAGETSIMDADDLTPRAIRLAGGNVEHYGAPVEPGNLLLMAYFNTGQKLIPLLGAPGCVRSRNANIVDLLLPRLLAGEHITRADIIALGHGGLL